MEREAKRTYIVFDLEWNQSSKVGDSRSGEVPFEIIEIGAVKLDENLEKIDEFHAIIKPVLYKEIHYKITEIIHLNAKILKKDGKHFRIAIKEFLQWIHRPAEEPIFCTWGNTDLMELQRNMAYHKIKYRFSKPLLYYDIQKLYARYQKQSERTTLETAIGELHIDKEFAFHDATGDAKYTAELMTRMGFLDYLPYVSTDYYEVPADETEEIYLTFPEYSKYISTTFATRDEAMHNKRVGDILCYKCRRMLSKKIRWFTSNQKIYYALALCPEHGYVQGKIRLKSTKDKRYFVVKTIKCVGEEKAKEIAEKKEEMRMKKSLKAKRDKRG